MWRIRLLTGHECSSGLHGPLIHVVLRPGELILIKLGSLRYSHYYRMDIGRTTKVVFLVAQEC